MTNTSNTVAIQFVQGGFMVASTVDGKTEFEVVPTVGKLNKLLRGKIDELSLVKKADKDDSSAE
jgi:hypothetical protein